MAKFEGTIQEFHNHIGPRIRNIVNLYAKKERMSRNGICEHCGCTNQTLDSAHIHGRDRRTIIESVLSSSIVDGTVKCDLLAAEKKILEAHNPIADTFKFLCKPCHIKYDNHDLKIQNARENKGENIKILFFPSDEEAFKEQLLDRKKAYIALYKTDGSVEHLVWSANKFKMTSNLRGNLFSGYLRNWKEKRIIKAVFSIEEKNLKYFA